jgi:hypothetical protein
VRTEHPYGKRPPKERVYHRNNRAWLCDNPHCGKVYHFSPYCTNTAYLRFRRIISRIVYRILTKLGM